MKPVTTIVLLLAIAIAVLAMVSGFGVRMEWWGYPVGFKLLKVSFGSALACAALSLILVAVGFLRKLPGKGRASLALTLSSVVALIPLLAVTEFRKVPTYGEACTDFQNVPAFERLAEARKRDAENPPLFSRDEAEEAQKKFFPKLGPIEVGLSPPDAREATRRTLQELRLSLASGEGGSGPIEATATSFWFGLKDDVVVVIGALPNGGSRINVRSASRVGKFDGGANATRVQDIVAALKQAR